jgi:hypothetical protein
MWIRRYRSAWSLTPDAESSRPQPQIIPSVSAQPLPGYRRTGTRSHHHPEKKDKKVRLGFKPRSLNPDPLM